MMFSEDRVPQMAAYFLQRSGGRMAYIKLIKLLYLADRTAMGKWGDSMSGDRFVSMDNGPVLSKTYALICGIQSYSKFGWNYWIKGEENYEVSVRRKADRDDLDELSEVDIEILEEVFEKFGSFERFALCDYTHDYCAEWEDPHGSSYPINPEDVFRALGKNEDQVHALVQHYNMQRQLDIVRNSL